MKSIILYSALLVLYGCKNYSNNNQESKEPIEVAETKPDVEKVDENFVGLWKIIELNNSGGKYDVSNQGVICELEKYKNEKSVYVFHFFDGHELMLTIKDENNLIGQNAAYTLTFDSDKKTLTVFNSEGRPDEILKRVK